MATAAEREASVPELSGIGTPERAGTRTHWCGRRMATTTAARYSLKKVERAFDPADDGSTYCAVHESGSRPKRTLACPPLMSAWRGKANTDLLPRLCLIVNQTARFTSVFNAAVGPQSHSPEQYCCYKFRGFWIPVAPPPPVCCSEEIAAARSRLANICNS